MLSLSRSPHPAFGICRYLQKLQQSLRISRERPMTRINHVQIPP